MIPVSKVRVLTAFRLHLGRLKHFKANGALRYSDERRRSLFLGSTEIRSADRDRSVGPCAQSPR
jgi:hypothetical protein